MVARLPLGIALAVALLLSGCSSPKEDASGAEEVSEITDPRDTAYLRDGATGEHIHNYWNGRDKVTVLETEGGSFSASCSGCDGGMVFQSRRPAEGDIVPQGTAWVNGTFTFTENPDGQNDYDGFELLVKTAEDAEAHLIGPIESGVQFSLNSSQDANDPPHYVLSLWRFEVRATGGNEIALSGSGSWKVEAVRGLPLVPYPPHPDRWDGATELEILSETKGSSLTYQMENSYSCYDGCPGTHRPPDGVVIPFDTSEVQVNLKFGPGVPAGLGLWVHGADSWESSKIEGELVVPGEYLFTIPLDGSIADSPYAPQSLWEFRVWLDQPQPGVQAWTGIYTLTVTAFK